MKYNRILVTGGCGFIGSNFIHYILERYNDVAIINLDKITYCGNLDNLRSIENNPRYEFIHGDICDSRLVNNIMKSVDAVVHFAAESHVDNSIKNCSEFVKTNVVGTQVLLSAAFSNNIKRFHHISTDEVFGTLGKTGEFNENTPYSPRSPYSASKAASDHLVRAFFHTHKLPIVITNCSNNYGPYQYPEKVIPLFITNLFEGKKVPVYGKGENIRDWLHVKDHCSAIDLVLNKGKDSETYCVGGNCRIRNIDMTLMILKEIGFGKEMIEFVEDRKGHDFRYAIDFSKINKEFGWKPKYDFKKGLKDTIDWYKNNKEWWTKLKKN
ncbi:dTDP-glucose 4,6-dehydratase [archaeon AH-315-M20]|nr:dTDP-glucose 4,6-dehydratase [archaeon AH-315-M20]